MNNTLFTCRTSAEYYLDDLDVILVAWQWFLSFYLVISETPVLWPPHVKSWLTGKDSDAGRDWGQEEKGTTEDEMAGWHRWLDGCESEWTPGVGDGQGGLVCCDLWGCKESDMTERLNWTEELLSCSLQNKLLNILKVGVHNINLYMILNQYSLCILHNITYLLTMYIYRQFLKFGGRMLCWLSYIHQFFILAF